MKKQITYVIRFSYSYEIESENKITGSELFCESWKSLCEELDRLKNLYRKDKFFMYGIYELKSINKSRIEDDLYFLDLRRISNFQNIVYEYEQKIWLLEEKIKIHQEIRKEYGSWEEWNNQFNTMNSELLNITESYREFLNTK